jgi:hypothetical protein
MPIFLGDKQIGAAALGNLPVSNIANVFVTTPPIPTDNLVFWLDATTFSTGSSTWNSNLGLPYSGSFTGQTPVQKRSDNGGVVNFTTSSAMRIGGAASLNYTAEDFTMFVATRYSGSSTDRHGRLLDGVTNNWLAPTYGGGGGAGDTEYWAAYFNTSTFIILSGSLYDTEWRISTIVRDKTNTSSSFYTNAVLAASGSNNATTNGFNGLAINNGSAATGTTNPGTGEVTQADVGDLILYNRVLNQSEITQVYNTLKGRYGL